MIITKNENLEIVDVKLHDLTGKKIINDLIQRGYSYEPKHAASLIEEVFELAKSNEIGNKSDWLFITVNIVNGKEYHIIDGHSRLMTFNLLLRAIKQYVVDKNIALDVEQFNLFEHVQYNEKDVNDEYRAFLKGEKAPRFDRVYKAIYKRVRENGVNIKKIVAIVKKFVVAHLVIMNNEELARDYFFIVNTKQKSLTPAETIHSLLKNASEHLQVEPIKYDPKKIYPLMLSYYNTYGEDKAFSSNFIDFVKTKVVDNEDQLDEFRNYVATLNQFEENVVLYKILDNFERRRVTKVAQALVGKGYKFDYSVKMNDDAKKIILGLVCFGIVGSVRNSNPSSITGAMFNKVMKDIGEGKKDLQTIYEDIENFVVNHQDMFSFSMDMFEKGLDRLSDESHKAIMVLDLWLHNRSCKLDYTNLNLEHCFNVNETLAWDDSWTSDKEKAKKLAQCIGNKLLLAGVDNRELKTHGLAVKGKIYEQNRSEFDKCTDTDLNQFDVVEYDKYREFYAYSRRRKYAEFIRSLPLGNILITK